MFTGIVESTGTISAITQNGSSLVLEIECPFAGELTLGESVAVNGTCLTVSKMTLKTFCADVTPETFRRTSLASLENGGIVNLERAMKADGRFGGHIVSGHIDGTGIFMAAQTEGNAVNMSITVPATLGKYIIEKGSVCVDGISLTVAKVESSGDTTFSVAVIPHTWQNTTLCHKNAGDKLNIECDVVGKYIEHFIKLDLPAQDEQVLQDMMTNFKSFH